MESLQGKLLIASPALLDPNFRQAVVLMVRHDGEGAMGLILNRPTTTMLAEAWKEVSDSPCSMEQPLRIGGPCPGPLVSLHTDDSLGQIQITSSLFFSAEAETMESLVMLSGQKARFFVGYAGWVTGQLESELDTGSWIIAPATVAHVFGGSDDLWKQEKRKASVRYIKSMNVRHLPEDPSDN